MIGAMYMILATLCFSIAYTFVKLVSIHIGVMETILFRSIITISIIFPYLCIKKIPVLGYPENKKYLVIRGIFGSLAMICYFMSLKWASLPNVFTLHNSYPLFTTILAFYLLQEKVTWSKIGLIGIALLGIILIIKPTHGIIKPSNLPALISAVFISIAYISIKFVSTREHPGSIIMSLNIGIFLLSLPITIIYWVSPTVHQIQLIFGAGILLTVAQFFLTISYKKEEASFISIFSFASILWSIIISYFVFNAVPTLIEMVGILLILITMISLVIIRAKEKVLYPRSTPCLK